ncbi:WD40 repeat domain-containing protein [Streptomyces sp. NPDC054932]
MLAHRSRTGGTAWLLGLDAVRWGARQLAADLSRPTDVRSRPFPWSVGWATGSQLSPRFMGFLTGHTSPVAAVATAAVDGRPVAVTGHADGTVRLWDLQTIAPIGPPLTGHAGAVEAVTTTELDGRPVAVTGSRDETARIWDLPGGAPVGHPLAGHRAPVTAVATAVLDGRPIALTGGDDCTLRIWDLRGQELLGRPLPCLIRGDWLDDAGWVMATVLDGTPVVLVGNEECAVSIRDLRTGEQRGRPVSSREVPLPGSGWVRAMTTAVVGNSPVVIAALPDDRTVRVWDLRSGEPLGAPPVFPQPVAALAWHPDGRLVVCFRWEVAVLEMSRRPC